MTVASHNFGSQDSAERTRVLLADLWRRNQPVIEDRLAILAHAGSLNPIPEDSRLAALDVSHKLSGSLGMFGYQEGTMIARELEQILGSAYPDAARITELTDQLRAMLLPAS